MRNFINHRNDRFRWFKGKPSLGRRSVWPAETIMCVSMCVSFLRVSPFKTSPIVIIGSSALSPTSFVGLFHFHRLRRLASMSENAYLFWTIIYSFSALMVARSLWTLGETKIIDTPAGRDVMLNRPGLSVNAMRIVATPSSFVGLSFKALQARWHCRRLFAPQ